MFRFFFKKNFFDLWDNLFLLITSNATMLLPVAASFLLVDMPLGSMLKVPAVILLCIIFSTLSYASGENATRIASFGTGHFTEYWKAIRHSFREGVKFGVLSGGLISVGFVSLPFYISMWQTNGGLSVFFLIPAVLIFWFLIITLMAFQWYFPLRFLMKDKFWKSVKKCYILFFDNTGLTVALFLVNILNTALSLVTVALIPGITGMIITNTNALRLLLYKYDWIEANPGITAKETRNVPWDGLLEKDKTTMGKRTLKSLIFPWKD